MKNANKYLRGHPILLFALLLLLGLNVVQYGFCARLRAVQAQNRETVQSQETVILAHQDTISELTAQNKSLTADAARLQEENEHLQIDLAGALGTEIDPKIVFITSSGECYRRKTCQYAVNAIAVTLTDAQALGRTPCQTCAP